MPVGNRGQNRRWSPISGIMILGTPELCLLLFNQHKMVDYLLQLWKGLFYNCCEVEKCFSALLQRMKRSFDTPDLHLF